MLIANNNAKEITQEMSECVRILSSCMKGKLAFVVQNFSFQARTFYMALASNFLLSSKSYVSEYSLSLLYNTALIN